MTTPTPTPTPRTDATAYEIHTRTDIKSVADLEESQAIERDLSGFLAVLGHPITPDDTADSASSKVVLAMTDLQAMKRDVAELKEQLKLCEWYKIKELADSYNHNGVIEHNILGHEWAFVLAGDYHRDVAKLKAQLIQRDAELKAANEDAERLASNLDTSVTQMREAMWHEVNYEGAKEALAAHRARTGGK